MSKLKIGDWIRFYINDILIIGEIRYIDTKASGHIYYSTDKGRIRSDDILEARIK